MRAFLLVAIAALAAAGATHATDIAGKWGLGVSIGEILSSRAEASLIRGTSNGRAWILDLSIDQAMQDLSGTDTSPLGGVVRTEDYDAREERTSYALGPRLRSYTRPDADFSPYWDVFLHGMGLVYRRSDNDRASDQIEAGGRVGVAFGVERFLPRWHVALAAHTGLVNFDLLRSTLHSIQGSAVSAPSTRHAKGWTQRVRSAIEPQLQARVYF